MKYDQNDIFSKEPQKVGFMRRVFGEKHAKARSLIHLMFAFLPMVGIAMTLFLPICDIRVSERWTDLIPIEALENMDDARMGSYVYLQLSVFLALILMLCIGAACFIKSLFSISNEEKLIQSTKSCVIFGLVVVGIFTLVSCLFSPINLLVGGACRTNVSFVAMIYMTVLVFLYAIFVGLIGIFKEKETNESLFEKRAMELRRKRQRALRLYKLELLMYALLNVGVAMAALLGKFLTVTFKSEYVDDIPMYTLSGFRLLTKPQEYTSQNERIVGFIVFALVVFCLTAAFLSVVSFFSRSAYFGKTAVTAVIIGSVSAMFIGLLGQYYRIIQNLNVEVIERIIASYTEYTEDAVSEFITFSIKSKSIIFFLISLGVVTILLCRRPYTKVIELEQQLAAEEMSKLPQTVEITGGQGNREPLAVEASLSGEGAGASGGMGSANSMGNPQQGDFDPCPAFTQLDSKAVEYRRALVEKQTALFENPSLPALVDFIVQYARNSQKHLFYTKETIAAFLAGLGTTRLTILQGMSGTGKTSLPKIVGEALSSVCDIVEVESSWRDKNELLGYYNEFNKIYTPKKFTQMLYRAGLNPDVITFIVLDEMNLSRIEYYFSDFLSLMENDPDQREIKLLNQPLFRRSNQKMIPYKLLHDGHTLKIPQNVWFVGTANRDESTYDISDKVYDRAHTMNFDKRAVRMQYYENAWAPRYLSVDQLTKLFEEAKARLPFNLEQHTVVAEVERLLAPYNISFGNRVAMQMESFVSIYASCFDVTDAVISEGLETILLSKVVRKLELKSIEDKEALAAEFDRLNLPRCSRFIRDIQED